MPDPVTPQNGSAAAAAPVKQSFDSAYNAALGGGDAPKPEAAPLKVDPAKPVIEQATVVSPRKFKAKLDHEEKDVDWDEWVKENETKGRLKDIYERDTMFDSLRERDRKAAEAAAINAAKKSWNDWLADHGFDVVEDKSHKSGWTPRKRAAIPATPEDADPLAKEAAELQPLADQGDVKAIRRLSQIDAERAKLDAIKTIDERQAKATQDAKKRDDDAKAKTWFNGEIDKLFSARAKSFENAKSLQARLHKAAFDAGDAAAREGKDPIAAAKAVIAEAADELDGQQAAWRKSASQPVATPQSAPIVGISPGGSGGGKKPTYDEAYEAAVKSL